MSAPLRVLVNAIHAKSGGGVTYLRNLLPELARDPGLSLVLLIHPTQAESLGGLGVEVAAVDHPSGFLAQLLWEQAAVPGIARRLETDVVFSPANFGPLFARNPVVAIQNSLAVGRAEARPSKRLYWWALTVMTAASLLFARGAVAVSSYAVAAAGWAARFARGPVAVVHHGVSAAFAPPSRPRGQSLLAVCDVYVQKNLATLIEALALARRDVPALTLAVAGAVIDAGHHADLLRRVETLGLADAVTFLGRRPEGELAELYRRCGIFVFPSVEESFGMPLLEAMASGCPIVCARAAAMPEVAGDSVLWVEPRDARAMADAILRLVRDPGLRAELSARAVERARRFTWREAAGRTAAVLKAAAGRGRG